MDVPGTICLPSDELSRYPQFAASLARLEKPPGTRILPVTGKNIVDGLNAMVREFSGDWMWVVDDDHGFDPDTLMRLLAHNVDIVAPLNVKRNPPFNPVLMAHGKPGLLSWRDLAGCHGLVNGDRDGRPLITGKSGMLIKRRVFDALGEPWFLPVPTDLYHSSDFVFCQRVLDRGFLIHIDLDVRMSHIGASEWIPAPVEGGEWGVFLKVAGHIVLMVKNERAYLFRAEEEAGID